MWAGTKAGAFTTPLVSGGVTVPLAGGRGCSSRLAGGAEAAWDPANIQRVSLTAGSRRVRNTLARPYLRDVAQRGGEGRGGALRRYALAAHSSSTRAVPRHVGPRRRGAWPVLGASARRAQGGQGCGAACASGARHGWRGRRQGALLVLRGRVLGAAEPHPGPPRVRGRGGAASAAGSRQVQGPTAWRQRERARLRAAEAAVRRRVRCYARAARGEEG